MDLHPAKDLNTHSILTRQCIMIIIMIEGIELPGLKVDIANKTSLKNQMLFI